MKSIRNRRSDVWKELQILLFKICFVLIDTTINSTSVEPVTNTIKRVEEKFVPKIKQ
jgi:hypothetical protein